MFKIKTPVVDRGFLFYTYTLTEHNWGFLALFGRFYKLFINGGGALFEQNNNRASAIKEHTLFLTAREAMLSVVIFYFSNQHCANLNL